MTESPTHYATTSEEDARQGDERLLAQIERLFTRRFGARAWGRVTVCVQDGRARTVEWSETVKTSE